MRFPSLTLLLACVMVVAGCGNAPNKSTSGKHNFQVKKVTDYLYEVTLDYDFDYSFSKPFTEKYRPNLPACSSISIGNFRGRNLDWYYEDGSDFVVHTTKREGRHASLAISSMPQISNSIAGDGQYHAEYEFIPFSSLDGINDAGVCVNLNVVPFQEYGKWQMKTETPDDDMMEFIAPRMILDKCATLTDVIPVLEKYDWFCVGNEFETHLMVSGPRSADDKTITTVVFEYVPFQDGDKTYRRLCCVSNDPKDIVIVGGDESRFHNCNADFLIMTNFNLWKFDASLDRKGRLLSAGEHPAGFERYEILEAAAGTAVDILGGAENLLSQHVQDIMYAVNYSNMYNIYQDNGSPGKICVLDN